MKNAKWILIPLLIVVVFAGAVMGASAANGTPGSETDPVVTKSYVDQTVRLAAEAAAKAAAEAAAKDAVSEALDDTVAELEATTARTLAASAGGTAFAVIKVPAGTALLGRSGTEIIVRSGTALALDNGEDGLCDVTAGADVGKSQTVTNNHLLICPRDDGRGVQAQSDIWVMVRGDYTFR